MRGGLSAPGDSITRLSTGGTATISGGTSDTPFVTGALALLWSEFPDARDSPTFGLLAGCGYLDGIVWVISSNFGPIFPIV
jgi:hypothetical protein